MPGQLWAKFGLAGSIYLEPSGTTSLKTMGLPMPLRLVVAVSALHLAAATTLSVSPTQLYAEEWDATASITYEVSVAAQPSSDVVVTITSSNASLATADAETLTFTSADYAAKTVTVTVADDNKAGASEHAVEFSHDCTGCDAATVTLTIFDDDYCARDCDAGAYSSTCNGTRRCLDCPRGATCAGGCDAPELCAPGTYKAVMGATNGDGCDACPAGHYAAEYGAVGRPASRVSTPSKRVRRSRGHSLSS